MHKNAVMLYMILVVQFPARGSTQVFPAVLWLWHFLSGVSPQPMSGLRVCAFVVSRAYMAGAASQAGLTSGLWGSVDVHRGALLLVSQ